MTKPKHRGNWLYLPGRKIFLNMDTISGVEVLDDIAKEQGKEKCILIIPLTSDPTNLFDSDAQAVIDFLIL